MNETPAAYLIGHLTVKDPDKWSTYRSLVPATLAPWGAEVVLRGHLVAVLAGPHHYTDTVVIRFPSTAAITEWYASPDYQALLPLRTAAAEIVLLSYEG